MSFLQYKAHPELHPINKFVSNKIYMTIKTLNLIVNKSFLHEVCVFAYEERV